MKRFALTIIGLTSGLILGGNAVAAGGAKAPYEFEPNASNKASLQRGARDFMAYCSGCHSLKYLRYNRLAADLEIPEDLLQQYLMFTSDKPGDHIVSAIPAESAEWFGQMPPDLSLTTRLRTPSWVYSYLLTFYLDEGKANGVNNLMLPGASMPHVLWELQGWQVHDESAAAGDDHHGPSVPLRKISEGSLSDKEYAARMGDLVNFMAYAAEPGKADRIALGWKVMAYLLLLFGISYLLKKEFWRDVH